MGFWNVTSSIDWCEENYSKSHFIAEFWNTISSFAMVISGFQIRNKEISRLLVSVGIGSVLFHMTLSRYAQAIDEVPMIWLSLFMIKYGTDKLGFKFKALRNLCLMAYGIIATLCITIFDNSKQFNIFHTFNGIVIIIVLLLFKQISKKNETCRKLYNTGVLWFGTGFTCWIIDLLFCDYIGQIPLHAIWHACSSIGVYKLAIIVQ